MWAEASAAADNKVGNLRKRNRGVRVPSGFHNPYCLGVRVPASQYNTYVCTKASRAHTGEQRYGSAVVALVSTALAVAARRDDAGAEARIVLSNEPPDAKQAPLHCLCTIACVHHCVAAMVCTSGCGTVE